VVASPGVRPPATTRKPQPPRVLPGPAEVMKGPSSAIVHACPRAIITHRPMTRATYKRFRRLVLHTETRSSDQSDIHMTEWLGSCHA
jgi:hypothetical protein